MAARVNDYPIAITDKALRDIIDTTANRNEAIARVLRFIARDIADHPTSPLGIIRRLEHYAIEIERGS